MFHRRGRRKYGQGFTSGNRSSANNHRDTKPASSIIQSVFYVADPKLEHEPEYPAISYGILFDLDRCTFVVY